MKVGLVLTAAIAALGLAASVTALTPDNSEQEAIQSIQYNIEVYKNKKMYSEAVSEYKKLFGYEQFSKDYDTWAEYKTYCFEHGFSDEFISAGKKMLSLNINELQPARDILEFYKTNNPDLTYSWIAQLRSNLPDESYREFGEYYDTIKGQYVYEETGFKELKDWSAAAFGKNGTEAYLIGTDREDKLCVIDANGRKLINGTFDTIYSYSYNDSLIATDNDGQIVYTNKDRSRKRVPYDYDNKALINHVYLGPYHNGIANYSDAEGKWGLLNNRADVIADGYEYATSGSDGIFAVKQSGGKWTVLRQNSSGGLSVLKETDYDDIRIDEYGYMEKYGVFFGQSGGVWYMNRIVVDDKGNYSVEIPDITFEDVKVFGDLGAVKISGQWGFADKSGNIVIEPQFDDAKSFSCGFAAVKKNGSWGYIDNTGKVIINYIFSDANTFSRYGVAGVKEGEEWNLIRLKEYEISGGTY